MRAQLCFQTRASSLAFRFAHSSKAWKRFLACLNDPIRGNRVDTIRLCAILRTPDPSTLAWSAVCVRSGESEEKAERMREEKETPFPSFPYGEWWNPIVGCLEFLR